MWQCFHVLQTITSNRWCEPMHARASRFQDTHEYLNRILPRNMRAHACACPCVGIQANVIPQGEHGDNHELAQLFAFCYLMWAKSANVFKAMLLVAVGVSRLVSSTAASEQCRVRPEEGRSSWCEAVQGTIWICLAFAWSVASHCDAVNLGG